MKRLDELAGQLGGKIRSQQLSNPHFGGISLRQLVLKRYRGLAVTIDEYPALFDIWIKVDGNVALTVNRPYSFFYSQPLDISGAPYPLYVSKNTDLPSRSGHLQRFWKLFFQLLTTLALSGEERINLFGNVLHIGLRRDKDIAADLDRVIDLIYAAPDVFTIRTSKPSVDYTSLPASLQGLAPLLKKYAIPDDSDRQEMKDKMTPKQKEKLIRTVMPHMKEINAYLDSLKDKVWSEAASQVGDLAGLVSELQVDSGK